MTLAITGWGSALPARVLDNAELAGRLDVSEEWIFQRTGIRARRIVDPADSTSSLAIAAGAEAMERAGIDPSDIDLVILATSTPDHQLPATASLVQDRLGCSRAGAYDLNACCAGFLYALAQAHACIAAGLHENVLVCGADVLSRFTDYSDPATSILFGDGAGAVVVQASRDIESAAGFVLGSDGSGVELLWIPPSEGVIRMQGREVYRRAVDEMTRALEEIVSLAGIAIDDVDLIVVHQANARIVRSVVERLGIDPSRAILNIESLGNTSAATIPLALSDAAEAGLLSSGALVAVAAFGAGFSWGAGLVRWEPAITSASGKLRLLEHA